MRLLHRGLIPFEHGVLACAVTFAAYLLTRYDMCFQDAEVLTQHMFDLGRQARLLSYAAYIATIETRLALWDLIPPHPSFTPVWALTLVLGPILLFRFLEIALRSRPAACAGTAVYLVSAGYLSGLTMLFHAAKPLTNVAVIAVLYLSARMAQDGGHAPTPPRRLWGGVLLLLMLAPFADQTAAFAYAIPLVWCSALFVPRHWPSPAARVYRRNWTTYLASAGAVAVVMLVIVPAVLGATTGRDLDLVAYMQDMSAAGAGHDKLNVRHIVWQAGNLLIPGLLPWQAAGVLTPVAAQPQLPILSLAVIGGGLLLTAIVVYRGREYWTPFWKVGALMGIFVIFESVVMVFHEQELSATGFYYGSIFSVLFASLMAVVVADAHRRGAAATYACRAGLLWVVAMSAMNFPAINASWKAHSAAKAINLVSIAERGWHGADTGPYRALVATHEARTAQAGQDAAEAHYSDDITVAGPVTPAADAFAVWRNWRQGNPDYFAGRPLAAGNLWLAIELDMKTRHLPRRWQTLFTRP